MEGDSRRTWEAALQLARADLKRLDNERTETMAIITAISHKLGDTAPTTPSPAPSARPRSGLSSVDVAYRVLHEADRPLTSVELLEGVRQHKPLEGKYAKPTFLRAIRMDNRFWEDANRLWRLSDWTETPDVSHDSNVQETPSVKEALAM